MKGSLIRAFLAITVALVGLVGIAPPVTQAAVCAGGTNTLICNGTVSPASGTTSTMFTFSVVYQDSKGRTPCFARVTIVGVGTFDMAPACSTLSKAALVAGTTFTYSTSLPPGSHTYEFMAGRVGGGQPRVLANPSPSPVSVTAPTPTPSPKPTPKPTPRPTPRATPKPTPRPTPKPGKTPAPKPGKTPGPSKGAHSPGPSVRPSASGDPSASAVIGGGISGGDPGDGGRGDGRPPGGPGLGPDAPIGGLAPTIGLLAAALGVASGPILMARRRRRRRVFAPGRATDEASDRRATANSVDTPTPVPTSSRGPALAATSIPDSGIAPRMGAVAQVDPAEAGMPRWRRPSVKDGRFMSDRTAAPPPRHVTFGSAVRPGVQRSAVRYHLVALLDQPDEVRGMPVADLREGDEVDVIGRRGVWLEVGTPRGLVGWLHRTTVEALEARENATPAASDPAGASAPRGDADDEAIDRGALDRMLAAIVAERQAAAQVAAGHADRPAADPPPASGSTLRPAYGDAPA